MPFRGVAKDKSQKKTPEKQTAATISLVTAARFLGNRRYSLFYSENLSMAVEISGTRQMIDA